MATTSSRSSTYRQHIVFPCASAVILSKADAFGCGVAAWKLQAHTLHTLPRKYVLCVGAAAMQLTRYEPQRCAADTVCGQAISSVPIATGERIYTRWGFNDIIAQSAVQVCHQLHCTERQINGPNHLGLWPAALRPA